MWNKASCVRKQHDGRLGSNHRPKDRKSNALTTRPPRLHAFVCSTNSIFVSCYHTLTLLEKNKLKRKASFQRVCIVIGFFTWIFDASQILQIQGFWVLTLMIHTTPTYVLNNFYLHLIYHILIIEQSFTGICTWNTLCLVLHASQ